MFRFTKMKFIFKHLNSQKYFAAFYLLYYQTMIIVIHRISKTVITVMATTTTTEFKWHKYKLQDSLYHQGIFYFFTPKKFRVMIGSIDWTRHVQKSSVTAISNINSTWNRLQWFFIAHYATSMTMYHLLRCLLAHASAQAKLQ